MGLMTLELAGALVLALIVVALIVAVSRATAYALRYADSLREREQLQAQVARQATVTESQQEIVSALVSIVARHAPEHLDRGPGGQILIIPESDESDESTENNDTDGVA